MKLHHRAASSPEMGRKMLELVLLGSLSLAPPKPISPLLPTQTEIPQEFPIAFSVGHSVPNRRTARRDGRPGPYRRSGEHRSKLSGWDILPSDGVGLLGPIPPRSSFSDVLGNPRARSSEPASMGDSSVAGAAGGVHLVEDLLPTSHGNISQDQIPPPGSDSPLAQQVPAGEKPLDLASGSTGLPPHHSGFTNLDNSQIHSQATHHSEQQALAPAFKAP